MLLSFHIASEGGLSSPSQLGRFLMMALLLTRLRRPQLGLIALILGLAMVSETMGAFHHQSTYGLGIGFANGFKLAYITTLAFVLSSWITERVFTSKQIVEHALNGALIYAINVIAALILGFGEKTYGGDTFGTKGFVPSNNGLSMTLGTIMVLSASAPSGIWSRLRSPALMAGCLFIGAKASIVFCGVYLGILFRRSSHLQKSLALALVCAAGYMYLDKILAAFSTIFDVIIFRFELNEGNLFKFLASGRDDYIAQALGNIRTDGVSILRLLTGLGALVSFRDLNTLALLHPLPGAQLVYETLETDLFDLLFQYGLLSTVVYLGVILSVGFRFVRARKPIHLTCWLLVSGFSLVAGHVLFNGMSATVVAVLIGVSAAPYHTPSKARDVAS